MWGEGLRSNQGQLSIRFNQFRQIAESTTLPSNTVARSYIKSISVPRADYDSIFKLRLG